MWATWANLGPRQGQTCAQIGPTSANNNNNKKQGRQRQPQQQQQPRAKTGANLRPNRANIGQQQQQQKKNNDDHDNNNNTNNTNNTNNNTRTWTWITPNAYLPRVCFGRRPAVRRKPHKSGRRPRGRARGIAGGLRLVTEGYIGWPPLLPTTSYLLPTHDYRCNLQCILRVVFKKHRFLQGFVAFAVSRIHLGDVKKPWVFHGFGS